MDSNFLFGVFILILPVVAIYLYRQQASRFKTIAKEMNARITKISQGITGASSGTIFSMEGLVDSMPYTIKVNVLYMGPNSSIAKLQLISPIRHQNRIRLEKKKPMLLSEMGSAIEILKEMEKNLPELIPKNLEGFLSKYLVSTDGMDDTQNLLNRLAENEDFTALISRFDIIEMKQQSIIFTKRYKARDLNKNNLHELLSHLKKLKQNLL